MRLPHGPGAHGAEIPQHHKTVGIARSQALIVSDESN